ncbi:MAG: hypothetical protein ACOYIP_06940 [Coriobacteriales bacterium]|jgi:hypothetical protein
MTVSTIRRFDYLTEHDYALEAALGLFNLSRDISHWRQTGMDYPDAALVGCRKIVELALKKSIALPPDNKMGFMDIIACAEDEGFLDHFVRLKCDEIRVKGNQGAHGVAKVIDAEMALGLLDDFLRWNAEKLGLIPPRATKSDKPQDPIFIVKPAEELEEISKKARIASSLSDNKDIEKKAQAAKKQAKKREERDRAKLKKMSELLKEAEAIEQPESPREVVAFGEAQQKLFETCESNLESMRDERKALEGSIETINAEIEEILSEHDFIKKLLHGDKRATDKQFDVMAFPRGSGSTTNILQIVGEAGTGKTLCLLAKIISETRTETDISGTVSFLEAPAKTALFVCFNKALAGYARNLLANYDGELPHIEVVHYDEFINQLVLDYPKSGYEHLADYACDVRYGEGESIIYGSHGFHNTSDSCLDYLKRAQQTVSAKHVDRANDYYLDSSRSEDLEWLMDELRWVEARFASDEDAAARYPKAERVGRGTQRRPNEEIRCIILEIRKEYNRLLAADGRYTIEQATKRLMNSEHLPSYDAIAIDEVQDFSLLSIQLLLRFRRSDNSMVFISGDENQKIYHRDFTWKELDEDLHGYTIALSENKRNSLAIQHFSNRLLGVDCPVELAKHFVYISNADDQKTIDLLRELVTRDSKRTTAFICNRASWKNRLKNAGLETNEAIGGDIFEPGLYLLGNLAGKGLEFDNVVVDYTTEIGEDEDAEKRLRYVHFTRARKRLYVRYQGNPPELLSKYYADFLE